MAKYDDEADDRDNLALAPPPVGSPAFDRGRSPELS
jgi:hypothetical protein